jgi:transposase
MRKLEISNAAVMQKAIQDEIARSEESRYDHRLHGILLVSKGKSCSEVAHLFGQGVRTVQYWVKRFESKGFAGLVDHERPGRPTELNEEVLKRLHVDLRRPPQELGYTQNLWDGKLLSHHLSERFGIKIGTRQCQRLFHKLEFRRRKPRGVIANADPLAREDFKKNSKN